MLACRHICLEGLSRQLHKSKWLPLKKVRKIIRLKLGIFYINIPKVLSKNSQFQRFTNLSYESSDSTIVTHELPNYESKCPNYHGPNCPINASMTAFYWIKVGQFYRNLRVLEIHGCCRHEYLLNLYSLQPYEQPTDIYLVHITFNAIFYKVYVQYFDAN